MPAGPWSKRFGSAGASQIGRGVAADSAGNVVVVGMFEGKLDFPQPLTGTWSCFVAKFGPNGEFRWAKRFVGAGCWDVAITAKSEIVVAGGISGTVDFGSVALKGDDLDVFVVKLDPGGNALWARSLGDANMQAAQAVAVDPSGAIAVAGDWDHVYHEKKGSPYDLFVAKFDPAGNRCSDRARSSQSASARLGIGKGKRHAGRGPREIFAT